LAQLHQRFRTSPKAKYWCPYCHAALYRWKHRTLVTIYKCPSDNCPAYVQAKSKLNPQEQRLRKRRTSQFKLRYQYREYHFSKEQLQHSKPDRSCIDLYRIHNTPHVLGLALTFHVSFAIPARKTARILKQVFNIRISYQTILNYTEAAAPYCHLFNLIYKGTIDDHNAGDETYIKIAGKNAFTFLFISVYNHKITAYHIDHTRDTLPATVAMTEATRTAKPDQHITLYTDANPAYRAGLHFINARCDSENDIQHRTITGLQNLDEESEINRHFKQIIERLNRTYKYHVRSANGFKSNNGAIAYTTLFVTHFNFLRPHMALNYNVPIPIKAVQECATIQQQWCRIIDIASRFTHWDDWYKTFQ
jgi:transposase-like protein